MAEVRDSMIRPAYGYRRQEACPRWENETPVQMMIWKVSSDVYVLGQQITLPLCVGLIQK